MQFSFKLFLLIFILAFVIGFSLTGFTYDITCPKCDGTGEVWGKWYDFNAHTWVYGYRTCPTCGGSGKVWMFSVTSISFMSFFAYALCFVVLFALEYVLISFQLRKNPWVKDIKEMRFWFNPAYFLWLFYTNRRKWNKFITAITFAAAIILIVDFGFVLAPTSTTITLWLHVTNNDFWKGWLLGTLLLIPFAIAWSQKLRKNNS